MDKLWTDRVRWFAAELLVVVAGVLIALGVQSWWSHRSDIGREHSYLMQLDADLKETVRLIDLADSIHHDRDRAGALLLHSYYSPVRPEHDSILRWYRQALWYEKPNPVLGTAEALVSTGDLALLRKTELRSAISNYLSQSTSLIAEHAVFESAWNEAARNVSGIIDMAEVLAASPPEVVDSLARTDPTYYVPAGERRRPFPLDTDALLTDRAAFNAISELNIAKRNMADIRSRMRRSAMSVRALVDAELGNSRRGE